MGFKKFINLFQKQIRKLEEVSRVLKFILCSNIEGVSQIWSYQPVFSSRKLYHKFSFFNKVKNQNPQNAIMQKWNFSLLLNMLKYYKNGEKKFFQYCIMDLFNNFFDVKMSSNNNSWLPSEISWYLTLFTTRETFLNFRICSNLSHLRKSKGGTYEFSKFKSFGKKARGIPYICFIWQCQKE